MLSVQAEVRPFLPFSTLAASARKADPPPLSSLPDDKKMKYLVVEGPEALAKLGNRDEVWSRVVAVITTGQAWQFGQYKWSDPKQLFHHGPFFPSPPPPFLARQD